MKEKTKRQNDENISEKYRREKEEKFSAKNLTNSTSYIREGMEKIITA